MVIKPFSQVSQRAQIASPKPVENEHWRPRADGVFLQSSQSEERQWKPNLSPAQMGGVREQLLQAQENRMSVDDLANLPAATWVILARQGSDGREALSLMRVQPGDAQVSRYGTKLPASSQTACFTSPDGYHFSGMAFSPANSDNGQTQIMPGDQLFQLADPSAAALLEKAEERDQSVSYFPERLKPENMPWGQKLKAKFQTSGSGFLPSISCTLKNPLPIRSSSLSSLLGF